MADGRAVELEKGAAESGTDVILSTESISSEKKRWNLLSPSRIIPITKAKE